MDKDYEKEWAEYRASERAAAESILSRLGYTLEDTQPHTEGERYLMQAVTTASGRKLILIGRRLEDDARVIIKVSTDPGGIREIEHERASRLMLERMGFSYASFLAPTELEFVRTRGMLISITEFIPQEQPFLDRTLEDQFTLALESFKAQESAHATTYGHYRRIRHAFDSRTAKTYRETTESFMGAIRTERPLDTSLGELLVRAQELLREHQDTLDQYGGFLTHTDFVPHNFRVVDGSLYLLDHSSLCFGNKYEGWARFINFMTLYHPALATALVSYVALNRASEESRALRLMRTYRLAELILYYARAVARSTGDLKILNEARIAFWTQALKALLDDVPLSEEVRAAYISTRDSLRSTEEKRRQQGLH